MLPDRKKSAAAENNMNDFYKYLYYKFTAGRTKWYPILSVYYLTYRCRFRCPYCSDGSGRPYYQIDSTDPTAAETFDYLSKIREYCGYVVITGGEPLEHPGFGNVMQQLPRLEFKQVILTTNGYDVDLYLPLIAQAVDTLVFSLDTLDHQKADSWHGIGPGSLGKILTNIQSAHDYPGKKYKITISSVITPWNIEDLYHVYEYAQKKNYEFAAAPQLIGVKPHHDLLDNLIYPAYRKFYDFLINEKNQGRRVFGTRSYLTYMRDLKQFRCYPFTMLVVGPNGEIFYPCLEIGHHAGNIIASRSLHGLHEMRQKGMALFGPQPVCDNRCQSACALGFSLFLKNPFPAIYNSIKEK